MNRGNAPLEDVPVVYDGGNWKWELEQARKDGLMDMPEGWQPIPASVIGSWNDFAPGDVPDPIIDRKPIPGNPSGPIVNGPLTAPTGTSPSAPSAPSAPSSPWSAPAASTQAATSSNAPRLSQDASGQWVLTEHGNRRPLQANEVADAQKYVSDFWTKFPTGFQPDNPNSIGDAYKQFLGRNATAAELASHAGNPGGLAGVIQTIANSPEAKAYAEKKQNGPAPNGTTTTTPGTTTQIPNNDPAALIRGLLGNGASSPEALAKLEPELAKYGIKLQKDSAGVIRGRLYLPNGEAVDVVNNNGWGQPWTFVNRGKSSGDGAAASSSASRTASSAIPTIGTTNGSNDFLAQIMAALSSQNNANEIDPQAQLQAALR